MFYNKNEITFIPVGKAKDLTGQKFNRLTVLGRAPHEYRGAYWWCECDCEQHHIVKVLGSHLIAGNVKSCGCLNKEIVSNIGKSTKQDLLNQTYNYLTVVRDSGKRAHNRGIIWVCECECGNFIEVRADQLKNNHTTSCGCRKISVGEEKIQRALREMNIVYEKEKAFSNLHFDNNINSHPRFDFYIPAQNIIIEFDGKQHFSEVSGMFKQISLAERQKRDKIKDEYCKQNNIHLIRIPYTDINYIDKKYLLDKGVKMIDE